MIKIYLDEKNWWKSTKKRLKTEKWRDGNVIDKLKTKNLWYKNIDFNLLHAIKNLPLQRFECWNFF